MSENRSNERVELRNRERSAPRLIQMAPSVTSLKLTIQERYATTSVKYRKHVVIQSAPALFVVSCGDERCEFGGHDITSTVMGALRARQTHCSGEHECPGTIGSARCSRRIEFELVAEYQAAERAPNA